MSVPITSQLVGVTVWKFARRRGARATLQLRYIHLGLF